MKLTKAYFVLYQISGDSGVSGRGVYLYESDNVKRVIEKMKDLGSMNDDRCHTSVLYTNAKAWG